MYCKRKRYSTFFSFSLCMKTGWRRREETKIWDRGAWSQWCSASYKVERKRSWKKKKKVTERDRQTVKGTDRGDPLHLEDARKISELPRIKLPKPIHKSYHCLFPAVPALLAANYFGPGVFRVVPLGGVWGWGEGVEGIWHAKTPLGLWKIVGHPRMPPY